MNRDFESLSDRRAIQTASFDGGVADSTKSQASEVDARLVTSYLSGDPQAFESIYVRHFPSLAAMASIMITSRADAADVVHDVFAIAMERLHQLENPAALASWLAQILRREVYRRSREWRDVTSLSHLSAEGAEFPAPYDPSNEAAIAIADETASIVRQSLAGLDRRDRTLFETMARQRLWRDDVLDTGPPVNEHCSDSRSIRTMTMRMRQRLAASRSAYLVARHGQHSCPHLRTLLKQWNGEFGPLIRKRISRHIDSCPRCEDSRRRLSSVTLFSLILACSTGSDCVAPGNDGAKPGSVPVVEPIKDAGPAR